MRKRLRSWSGPVLPAGWSGEGGCFGEGELVLREGEGGVGVSVVAGGSAMLALALEDMAMGEERKEFLRVEVKRKRELEGRRGLCEASPSGLGGASR